MTERQKEILKLLGRHQELSVSDLSDHFGVSGVTVRGDLDHLQDEGFLRRVHGGAVLHGRDDIARRIGINYENKISIAERAAAYVRSGETVFIEAGSANALLARQLARRSGIQVVTNNVFITRQLKDTEVEVILLGGVYQHDSECVVGSLARIGMENLNFTKAFIGVDGVTAASGFTCSNMLRAEIAREAIARSSESFVVTDSTKFGKIALTQVCPLSGIDHIVTDADITREIRRELRNAGVTVDAGGSVGAGGSVDAGRSVNEE